MAYRGFLVVDLMSGKELAALLQVRENTLNVWRCKGLGPAYIKVGSAVRYRRRDVETWLKSRVVRPGKNGS